MQTEHAQLNNSYWVENIAKDFQSNTKSHLISVPAASTRSALISGRKARSMALSLWKALTRELFKLLFRLIEGPASGTALKERLLAEELAMRASCLKFLGKCDQLSHISRALQRN
jgi:hypothetical protein